MSKFIILSGPRSGSTWLTDLLNSHPQIRAYGEVFLNEQRKDHVKDFNKHLLPEYRFYDFQINNKIPRPFSTFKYLKYIEDLSTEYRAYGFKLMYDHFFYSPELLFKTFCRRYKIIHLTRNNLFDLYISILTAKQRKLPHTIKFVDNVADHKIQIDTLDLLSFFQKVTKRRAFINNLIRFSGFEFTNICYESLMRHHSETMDELCEYLDVYDFSHASSSQLKKINLGSHSERISNFDEVISVLKKTNYDVFLP